METYQNFSLEDLPNEEWRDVIGYEGLYQVSNLGRVKSLPRKHQLRCIIVAQHPTGGGYLTVTFTKNRKRKNFRTHKLVALCFLPIEEGKDEINHINENKFDNSVGNLMRCDRLFNVNYGNRNLIVGYKLRNRKDQSKKVYQLDEYGNVIKIFRSCGEAARLYNISKNGISRVCRGERKSYKNMYFKY